MYVAMGSCESRKSCRCILNGCELRLHDLLPSDFVSLPSEDGRIRIPPPWHPHSPSVRPHDLRSAAPRSAAARSGASERRGAEVVVVRPTTTPQPLKMTNGSLLTTITIARLVGSLPQ